jgi:6-methylsalicylic acid synthase
LSSRLAGQDSDQSWLTHSAAEVAEMSGDEPGLLRPDLAGAEILDPACVMDRLHAIGVVGIGFPWQVTEVRRSPEQLLARIAADPDKLMATATWGSLFDGGLSAAPVLFPGLPRLRMPSRLREVAVYGDPPPEALVGVRLVDVQWDGQQAADVEVDVTLADLDGTVLARLLGVHFGVVQLAALPEPEPAGQLSERLEEEWLELADAELADYVSAAVLGVVATELRADPVDLDVHRPLTEMGVDSLLSESIRQQLSRQFRTGLPSSLLWDCPSIASVAEYLAQLVASSRSADECPAA